MPETIAANHLRISAITLAATTAAFTLSGPAPCPGDITANHVVDIDDLLEVINAWGPCA